MDPRVAKLPVWAQDLIHTQDRNVTRLTARLAQSDAGGYPADTLRIESAVDFSLVPTHSRSARFFFSDQPSDFIDFRREHNNPRLLYVHSGWTRLLVQPAAGNAVYLSTEPR